MFIQILRLDGRNNNSNKNIKLQNESFLKKMSLQLYFKRVNVPTVSKARWQSIPYCWSSMENGSTNSMEYGAGARKTDYFWATKLISCVQRPHFLRKAEGAALHMLPNLLPNISKSSCSLLLQGLDEWSKNATIFLGLAY